MTDPLPLPVEPLVMVIHAALLVAVQLHPVDAVTLTVPEAPVAATLADPGEIVGEHVPAAWFTVNVTPPIETVPVRAAAMVFAATVYESVPLPVPVPPAVTVIHASLLIAVQPQPVGALTVTTLDVPDDVVDTDAGETPETQLTPACVTVNVWPPIVSVPVREVVPVLAATL